MTPFFLPKIQIIDYFSLPLLTTLATITAQKRVRSKHICISVYTLHNKIYRKSNRLGQISLANAVLLANQSRLKLTFNIIVR